MCVKGFGRVLTVCLAFIFLTKKGRQQIKLLNYFTYDNLILKKKVKIIRCGITTDAYGQISDPE